MTTLSTSFSKTKLPITVQDAFDILYEVIDSVPADHYYPEDEKRHLHDREDLPLSPVYFREDGEPSCIIGHVLARLGFTREDVVLAVGGSQWADVDDLCEQLEWPNRFAESPFDFDAVDVFSMAQTFQDRGTPWGRIPAALAFTRKSLAQYVRPGSPEWPASTATVTATNE